MIDVLIGDVASMSDNKMFPVNRQFDGLMGMHYASGHGAFDSGNNQESSSEAMNYNAALILYGSVMGKLDLRDLGVWMYASESAAIMNYWFDDGNYPEGYGVPASAIVWDDGGSYEIFWGPPHPEEVQGINVLRCN